MKKKHLFWTLIVIFAVLLIDQTLKIWIKTHMQIGESSYTNWNWKLKWAQLLFVENRGMAFGMQLPGQNGKVLLTILRLIIITGLGYYISTLIKKRAPIPLLITMALIFAGAAGNIIDSMFYGLIFSKSPEIYSIGAQLEPAKLVAFGHGYAGFMHGSVVDMLYFPLFNVKLPDFLPIWGGTYFSFFDPIFNVSDSAISVGVVILLLFSRKWFRVMDTEKEIENKPVNEQQ